MFDTGSSSLADEVECPLPDDLTTAAVNRRSGNVQGDS